MIHVTGLRTDFPVWFNEMNHINRNVHAKGTFCPLVNGGVSNGPETFRWLARRHRYVGEKVAFRHEKLGYDLEEFFRFHTRYFFSSHYLCVIRNPIDVLLSNNEMFKPDDLSLYAESYLRTLELCLALYDTLPNVLMLFHEDIDQGTFNMIGKKLGIDLSTSGASYQKKIQAAGRHEGDPTAIERFDVLLDVHRQMKAAFSRETLRDIPSPRSLQLAQYIKAARENIPVPPPPENGLH